ncbi:RdRp [Beihai picobirna-like virus 8]|uniref:RdRp n=1 Tax=Beihai picobirna-like virus 8 TaxID=1922525 RepID=UPI00090A1BD6|nr:RdRp [Beihai picobirna-like virus 8]APG78174.1 RdRp [Beihai picobirna-like virus 8]APG78187.1 RdRp [Beihai picobirna-like virus 8]
MVKHNQFSFLDSLDLDKEVKLRLSSNLLNIIQGNDTVLYSPLVKSVKPESILTGWDKIFKSKSVKMNKVLHDLEDDNRSKYGPRSIAVPWVDRRSDVLSYFESNNMERPPLGLPSLRRNLRPLELDKAIKLLKNDTNSGLPYYRRKGGLKDIYLKEFTNILPREDPCVMFTRTQEGKKTRTVWGYPMADTVNEMCVYSPLLGYQRKLNWRSCLNSPDAVNIEITKLIDKALKQDVSLLSIDFSAYDASLDRPLQKAAFEYISKLFQPSYEELINNLFNRFNTIGLVTPDGILSGHHGVPSGSTFTNEVDSIIQYLIALDYGLEDSSMQIQGDDGVYCVQDGTALAEHFKSFGLNVNFEKSYYSKDYCVYLQNLYHNDYRDSSGKICGIYPTYRALNRLIHPERFVDFEDIKISGRDYFSIRSICILENCKYHPLFEDLVKYIYKLDKYNLKFSRDSLFRFVQNRKQESGVQGIFNYRYEDDVSGIDSFETMKVLNKL